MITLKERNKLFAALTQRMNDLQAKKGADYGEDNDGLKNLRRRGQDGILARMGDKLSRLESLTKPERAAQVANESVEDTALDMACYSLLLIILRNEDL